MESKNLGYSVKNIPLGNKDKYLKTLISKTENFVRRLRWKVFHFLKKENELDNDYHKNTFGFATEYSPPKNQLLYDFENDLYGLIKNIEFKTVSNTFQKQISADIKSIKNSDKLYVKADKTRNIYCLNPDEYEKLLINNVTKTYKKCNNDDVDQVNKDAKQISEDLDISERVQVMAEKPAFITIKDHKDDFPNKVSCRLLNPCKSEIGKVSKIYLEAINNSIRGSAEFNQWRNTDSVIQWFRSINDKKQCKFIKFDIVSFYPSISQELLLKAINFAQEYTNITQHTIDTIMNSRKSFLFHKDAPWVKKCTNEHFDVTEGSYDGAEICELVGLFILSKLKLLFNNGSVGLYRDDGLGIVNNYSGPQIDRLRKEIIKVFKDEHMQITININLTVVDFLDVKLDLENDKYYPFKKPNDTPLYVHMESNHPPSILKQIPKMTSIRLSKLSCNEDEFNKAAHDYQDVLTKSGFREKLIYMPERRNRRQRKRNILWYNPPYDLRVKTNLAKKFLALIDNHFPGNHKLHKILNRNTVKVSYSCMPNLETYVSSHNKKLLHKHATPPNAIVESCNCRNKAQCPLNGNCQATAIVYKASVKSENDNIKKYLGISEPPFKERFGDHKSSITNKEYSQKTELSKYIWDMKDKGTTININDVKFSILVKSYPYQAGSKTCDLCLSEKLCIMKGDDSLLNKNNELVTKCRHMNKYLLKNFKSRNR